MSIARSNAAIRKPLARREGYSDFMAGYVTTLVAVIGCAPGDLEARLGFGRGMLARGWALYFLVQGVGPGEFRWRGRTRHAAGWAWDDDAADMAKKLTGRDPDESDPECYAQHSDRVRASFFRKHRENAERADAEFDLLMVDQQKRLNVRDGPQRIVKVVPIERKNDFPDAPGRGVPQWELLTKKEFRCAAVVRPGARYAGGAAGRALTDS